MDAPADATRAVVKRLARPHASGGVVIERSVILAEGASTAAILSWISDHGGVADSTVAATRSGGLHGSRANVGTAQNAGAARRFVLPASAFD
jgi:hypothetical protein